MKTCGTCKHFQPDGRWVRDVHSECYVNGMGACTRIKPGDTNASSELAATTDGSGYHAALLCRTDFGCVLHEPVPAAPRAPSPRECQVCGSQSHSTAACDRG